MTYPQIKPANLVTIPSSIAPSPFTELLWRYDSVRASKAKIPELNYVAYSSVQFSNRIRIEVMHNVSAYQQPRHWQSHWVPTMVWTASVMGYTRNKLARTNILQNFWLALKIGFYGISTLLGYSMLHSLLTYISNLRFVNREICKGIFNNILNGFKQE